MTETAAESTAPPVRDIGLLGRVAGVLFSPRETYAAVAARPRALGALLLGGLVIVVAQYFLLSSEIGREITLDQQVSAMESLGFTVTDEMYTQMEASVERSAYTGPIFTLIFLPIGNLITAGILYGVFTMLFGGSGTFKQVYAVAAHPTIIVGLQTALVTAMTLAAGRAAGANLGVFVPMLEETSFISRLLSSIDLFYIWICVNMAIGLGVLYRRRTGPIAIGLLSIYAVIAVAIAVFRSGS